MNLPVFVKIDANSAIAVFMEMAVRWEFQPERFNVIPKVSQFVDECSKRFVILQLCDVKHMHQLSDILFVLCSELLVQYNVANCEW